MCMLKVHTKLQKLRRNISGVVIKLENKVM